MSNLDAVKALQAKQDEELAARDAAIEAAIAKYSAQKPTQDDKQAEHDELVSMCNEVSMLELARRDTGEQGVASGEYVAFRDCPLCGHTDCFRVYPDTNTCTCFSASNPNTKAGKMGAGGSVLDYLQQRHGGDITAAVRELRELAGHPFKPKRKATRDAQGMPDGLLLPPWESVRASDPPPRNPPLIHGILRQGHVMLISGKGKGSKTWTAIELAVAVATGGKWFGFKCEQGGVLYIDPEMDCKSLDNRFHEVAEHVGVAQRTIDSRVEKWCLRGVLTINGNAPTIADIAHDVAARCSYGDFALVVVDSASCFIDGDGENSSGEVRKFFASILRISEVTGAAVLVVHHMGKGAKGDSDPIERSRGSSVWGDGPDAPLSLIEIFPPSGKPSDYLNGGERAFVLEDSGLREFPGIEPRHVIFSHPTHRVDSEGVTDGWKAKSGQKDGGENSGKVRRVKAEADRLKDEMLIASYFIRNGIGKDGVAVSEIAREVFGQDRTDKTKRVVEASRIFALFKPTRNRLNVVPIEPPPEPPEQPPTLDLGSS